MTPTEFKDAWIAALRSGEYKQHRGGLINYEADAFCCIGVGALVAGLPLEDLHCGEGYMRVGELANLEKTEIDLLWRMNDVEHKTFPEIADWIEENVP